MVCALRIILLFVLVELATSSIFNGSFLEETDNDIDPPKSKNDPSGRRQNKISRSTSSSSGEKVVGGGSAKHGSSLDLSVSSSSSSTENENKKKTTKKSHKPKSSPERQGWRKWHRKCYKCPADMVQKWRDPSIKWICGAYQRARRSFKSLCMMHFRNCQDGTMFTKISDHRCQNDTDDVTHGNHFFYDYKVTLSGDSSSSVNSKSSSKSMSSSSSSSQSSESWDSEKLASAQMHVNDIKNDEE